VGPGTGQGPVTSAGLADLLRRRYAAPEFALFFEVFQGTGYGSGGRADAVAMNLYPSQGLTVHGFELKVSRSDWLKEMRQPAKAETIFGYCDHWWLVVSDPAICKHEEGELPKPWGLLAPRLHKDRGVELHPVVKAPRLAPRALDREFIAVLARRANTQMEEELEDRVRARMAKEHAEAEQTRRAAVERGLEKYRDLAATVAEFEKASGISILRGYEGAEKIGDAVRAVLKGDLRARARDIEYAANQLKATEAALRALVGVITSAPAAPSVERQA
jgi:hypothetical protein